MMLRICLALLLLALFSYPAWAQRIILTEQAPAGLEELMDRAAADAFFEIRQKYNDLQQNFDTHFRTSGIDLDCRTGASAPKDGRSFSSLRVENRIRPAPGTPTAAVLTLTSISHYDCFAELLFVERISVVAPIPTPLSVEQAVKFRRVFHAQIGEQSREYSFEGADGKSLFKSQSNRSGDAAAGRLRVNMWLADLEWMRFEQTENSDHERRFNVQMYSGRFPVGTGTFDIEFGLPSVSVQQLWTRQRLIHEVENEVVSQAQFDGHMQSLVVGLTAQFVQYATQIYIAKLPVTTKTFSGVADSPFLRELQLNYNRLISKKDEAQVRKFFEKTIQDIKEGRLRVE